MKLLRFRFSDLAIPSYRYILLYIKKYHFKSMIYKIVKKLSKKLSLNCQTFVKPVII